MTSPVAVKDRWPNAQAFCQFIGWPRSGSTLVAALLDAHPEVDISHEADVALAISQGASSEIICDLMERAQQRFADGGRQWFGYDYNILPSSDDRNSEAAEQLATVVGDKKAGGTAEAVALQPSVLTRTSEVVGLPLRLLSVVRNPYDVVATISKNLPGDVPPWFRVGDDPVTSAIDWFFLLASITQRVLEDVNIATHVIYLEDLVNDPRTSVCEVLSFLDVTEVTEPYLQAVESAVFPSIRHSASQVVWSRQQRGRMDEGIAALPFLKYEARGTR